MGLGLHVFDSPRSAGSTSIFNLDPVFRVITFNWHVLLFANLGYYLAFAAVRFACNFLEVSLASIREDYLYK